MHIQAQQLPDQYLIIDKCVTDGPISIIAANMDGDTDLDVICASQREDIILWFENLDGEGRFGPKIVVGIVSRQVLSASAMDADHDGDLDLLVATIGDSSITCFLNSDGTGKFGQTLSLSGWFEYVINADVDGNGDLDIISGHLYDMVWY